MSIINDNADDGDTANKGDLPISHLTSFSCISIDSRSSLMHWASSTSWRSVLTTGDHSRSGTGAPVGSDLSMSVCIQCITIISRPIGMSSSKSQAPENTHSRSVRLKFHLARLDSTRLNTFDFVEPVEHVETSVSSETNRALPTWRTTNDLVQV